MRTQKVLLDQSIVRIGKKTRAHKGFARLVDSENWSKKKTQKKHAHTKVLLDQSIVGIGLKKIIKKTKNTTAHKSVASLVDGENW